MRPLNELIAEVKFDTNVDKSSRFTDERLLRMFDAAQRQIQMVIFNAYPQDPIFSECKTYDIDGTTAQFKLPLNKMLTPNSVFSVSIVEVTNRRSDPLPRLSLQERNKEYGYYLLDGFLYVEPASTISNYTSGELQFIYAPILKRLTAVTQVSELPTICEEYMIMWVERKINYVKSSKDVTNSNVFTKEERREIAELFADSARDPKRPPTSNEEYIAY